MMAGEICSEEEVPSEARVSLLGDRRTELGQPGLVHTWD